MDSPSALAHCVNLFGLSDVGFTIISTKHEIPSHQSAVGTGRTGPNSCAHPFSAAVDLHVVNGVPVPHRFEERVAEPEKVLDRVIRTYVLFCHEQAITA
jgi:hypothetical protein